MSRFYASPATVPAGTGTLTFGTPSTVTTDTKVNGWPSIARMVGGSLLLIYSKVDALSGAGLTQIAVRKVSTNDGGSWSSEVTVKSDGSHGILGGPLAVLASGRIVFEYDICDDNAYTRPVPSMRVIYSDDNAATWSSPYTVATTFTGICAGSGSAPIQLADGTVIQTGYGGDTGYTYETAVLFKSTDDGATWGGQIVIANGPTDSRHYDEPALAILPSGDILCQLRTTSGSPGAIYQTSSTDDGGTWSATALAIPNGYAQTHLYRRPSTGTLVAMTRDNTTADMIIYTSIDDGATWVSQGIPDTDGSIMDYADAIDRLDGSLLIVYGVTTGTTAIIKQMVVTESLA